MTVPDAPLPDVWSLVDDEPALGDDQPHLAGWMQRLCRVASRELMASGVGVSIMSPQGDATVLAASSPASEVIEQLQLTVGEGPCLDAFNFGRPVLTPDLSEVATSRWPGYASAAQAQGVRGVFAFPLQLGAARLGAMDVYREQVGSLPQRSVTQALAFAEAAMTVLLDAQERTGAGGPSAVDHALGNRLEVYQAQGMVHVQLGVSLSEAMVRLRGYAYAHDRPLGEVAADVVARRLVFEQDL